MVNNERKSQMLFFFFLTVVIENPFGRENKLAVRKDNITNVLSVLDRCFIPVILLIVLNVSCMSACLISRLKY